MSVLNLPCAATRSYSCYCCRDWAEQKLPAPSPQCETHLQRAARMVYKEESPILHQEVLNEAKDRIQEVTGLRPTNGRLLKNIQALKIQPRIKDHMRGMLTGKTKCGTYWSKVLGHTERAYCPFCKKKRNIEVIETEQHMWLECANSSQAKARETTEKIRCKTSEREWLPRFGSPDFWK